MMNIQIFGTKKCNETKKAERFFKERGIKYQFVDMKEKGLSKGEFNSVCQAVGGYEKLIDPKCKDKNLLALVQYLSEEDKKEKILEILQEAFDYEQEEQRGPRIRLHTDAGYQEFYMQDICYFEYRDRKIRIVTQNGEAWMRGSISKMAESFQNMGFAVPHKSFVVNLRHIKDIKGCDLLMTTGEIVPLSQKKAADFRALLTRWLAQQV